MDGKKSKAYSVHYMDGKKSKAYSVHYMDGKKSTKAKDSTKFYFELMREAYLYQSYPSTTCTIAFLRDWFNFKVYSRDITTVKSGTFNKRIKVFNKRIKVFNSDS